MENATVVAGLHCNSHGLTAQYPFHFRTNIRLVGIPIQLPIRIQKIACNTSNGWLKGMLITNYDYLAVSVMIRSIISRDTCINHHVTNVQHGSVCSCTTFNCYTTWLVVFKYNNIQLHCGSGEITQVRLPKPCYRKINVRVKVV